MKNEDLVDKKENCQSLDCKQSRKVKELKLIIT